MKYSTQHRASLLAAGALALTFLVIASRPGGEGVTAPFHVDPIEVKVDGLGPRVKTPVVFALTNRDSRTWRIVGTPGICSKLGCLTAVDWPAELAPNQSGTFHYLLSDNLSNPIDFSTVIYVEAEKGVGLTIPVTVRGMLEGSNRDPLMTSNPR